MNFFKEFKEFAMKGNLIDMAVAFVMGGAFGTLVNKFIEGIVMPLVGKLTAGVDYNSLKFVMSEAKVDENGKIITEAAILRYGEFITVFINFLIVAFFMFLVIKAMNKVKRKNETAPPPALTEDQKLLGEIRDLLKAANKDK